MGTATSYEISDVDPTGGGDYLSYDQWWTDKKDGGGSGDVAAWARSFSGGDLGNVQIKDAGYDSTAEFYTRIYPADGHKQDGTYSTTQGARVNVTSAARLGIWIKENYTRVEGLRVVIDANNAGDSFGIHTDSSNPTTGILIKGVCVVVSSAATPFWCIRGIGPYGGSITIRNCLVYGNNTSVQGYGIVVYARANGTYTATVQNCSVSQVSTYINTQGIGFWAVTTGAGQTAMLNVTSTNNISTGNRADYNEYWSGPGAEDINVTQTYCLSSDPMADDWGGDGNLVDQIASDVFTNVASDLTLKQNSPAMGVGSDLSGTFTDDSIGNTRYSPWDMGALAAFAGDGYRLYRGTGSVDSVDFSTVLATIPGKQTQFMFKSLGHAAGTKYTYVLRPVRTDATDALLETPDYSCFTEFETDGDTEWLGDRPAPVQVIEAEVLSGGEIRLRWRYRTPYGGSAPNDFGIYYQSTPGITAGAPEETTGYTSDGEYSTDLSLVGGTTYYFAVTARTSGGVESYLSNVIGPYIADDTAPAQPALIASTTF